MLPELIRSLTMWRSRRVVRCRTTAFPTALETMNPQRHCAGDSGAAACSGSPALSSTEQTTVGLPARAPRRTTAEKSFDAVIRLLLASMLSSAQDRKCPPPASAGTGSSCSDSQAESDLRPLPRRAEMIERPARVRIRARKPCLRLRRRLLGWKVRLLTVYSQMDGRSLDCLWHHRTAGTGHDGAQWSPRRPTNTTRLPCSGSTPRGVPGPGLNSLRPVFSALVG